MSNNVEVEVQNETFTDKILDYLDKLHQDLEATKKEVEFHKLIVSTFEEHGVEHPYIKVVKESIEETEKLIAALEEREVQAQRLKQFLEGNLVLDFDKFVFLMIDITGRQVVNYVELKNEFLEVSKKWKQK